MGIARAYESEIPSPPTSSPENPIAKRDLHLNRDGISKRPVTQLLDSPWTLQPPRLQTRIHSPQDLRNAVKSAGYYDGYSSPGASAPSFLPFSGNFVLDASFTLPDNTEPLLERVRKLDPSQKADYADLAKYLIYIIEETDRYTYLRQGNGSQLSGLKTVAGWYFRYVCNASREHFPESNNIGDCRGSIYVSISTERIYIYYTHRDLHEPATPRNFPVTLESVEEVPEDIEQSEESDHENLEEIPPDLFCDEFLTPRPQTLQRKESSISRHTASSPSHSLRSESPDSIRSEPKSGRNSPSLPQYNILPKVHPTPAGVDGSVQRNHMKLGALRDLVDSWLPEDDSEDGDETKINPFLPMTFRFMVEWFESSIGHPNVQREIYKILDLENSRGAEDVVTGFNKSTDVSGEPIRDELFRQPPTSSKWVKDTGSPRPRLTIDVPKTPRRSVKDLLKIGHGTMLSPIIEDPVKRPSNEKRKSSDGLYTSGEKKKKSKTSPWDFGIPDITALREEGVGVV